MNSAVSNDLTHVPYRDQLVGNIAATLPGASALFRASRIDFCCGGDIVLGEAARARGLDVAALEASLHGLHADAAATPPDPTDALVNHILTRYHETHRRELVELVRLARKVEAVHREHPNVPRGLADELEGLRLELHEHMRREEEVLFPLMLAGGHEAIADPIEQMRQEHRHHGARLLRLEELARDFVAPVDACRSWCALYAGAAKLVDDVREHIHLENNVLFPRFGPTCQA
jgi:regulator of cell morphogenesis and NO signaling